MIYIDEHIEKIDEMAEKFMKRLLNDEYKVAVLPNAAKPYCEGKEKMDLDSILNLDTSSRLFNAKVEY